MEGQLLLKDDFQSVADSPHTSLFLHPLVIPLYLSGASAFVFLVQAIYRSKSFKSFLRRARKKSTSLLPEPLEDDVEPPRPDAGLWSGVAGHVRACGGVVIFSYKVVQLLSCMGLVGISVAALVLSKTREDGKRRHSSHDAWFSEFGWIQLALSVFYVRILQCTLFSMIAY